MMPRQPVNSDSRPALHKAAALVEHHANLAVLLAVLCLVFAVNFFFLGPGSDGGSGLGGTGKFGGESGLGGTGKTPDSGPSFKLGANDTDDQDRADYEQTLTPGYRELHALLDGPDTPPAVPAKTDVAFDVDELRLSLDDALPATADRAVPANARLAVDTLVSAISLDAGKGDIDRILQDEMTVISANALVSSEEILGGLMLAEAETGMTLDGPDGHADAAVRNRVNMPVRPERPDRLNLPTRVTAVQRASIPAPPPVRPMRTMSSLLNH